MSRPDLVGRLAEVVGRGMTADRHRERRTAWLIAGAVWLTAGIAGMRWPWINTYLAPRGGWIWCVVGAAYHHGWLQAHRSAVTVIDIPGGILTVPRRLSRAEVREIRRRWLAAFDDGTSPRDASYEP